MKIELQMADLSAADQARKAMRHALLQIHERPPVAWYLGHGTQTFALLTEALAAHSDKSVEEIRDIYEPAPQRTFENGELNQCPFCGSQYLETKEGVCCFTVECGDCLATGPEGETADQAIEKWNARTMPHR